MTYLGRRGLSGRAARNYSGAYYQAPMTSEAVNMRADYMPVESLITGLFLQFKNENYNYRGGHRRQRRHRRDDAADRRGRRHQAGYTLERRAGHQLAAKPQIKFIFSIPIERLFYINLGNGACAKPADIGACLAAPDRRLQPEQADQQTPIRSASAANGE